MDDSKTEANTEYDGPSKSQLKRDSHALQAMGQELVEMPEGKLQKFNLPDALKDAIYEARRLKSREAKRRHLQYIGKLMRISDIDNIQATLEKMDHQSLTYRHHFQRLEAWRDSLVNEGNEAIENFLIDYPTADRQQLRNLQRQANRELELKKPPAAARKIFQYIRSLAD
ncbi:MAG: ribosome biogenesis factor YjgA [Porticoccaceae bacterium]|nr:ribosome biogenesis factor YjgA [Porticoccaceae bacterium]MDG1475006.1 ribosome biogenesis factor YjgA [Porticoccaceae bacterium]